MRVLTTKVGSLQFTALHPSTRSHTGVEYHLDGPTLRYPEYRPYQSYLRLTVRPVTRVHQGFQVLVPEHVYLGYCRYYTANTLLQSIRFSDTGLPTGYRAIG